MNITGSGIYINDNGWVISNTGSLTINGTSSTSKVQIKGSKIITQRTGTSEASGYATIMLNSGMSLFNAKNALISDNGSGTVSEFVPVFASGKISDVVLDTVEISATFQKGTGSIVQHMSAMYFKGVYKTNTSTSMTLTVKGNSKIISYINTITFNSTSKANMVIGNQDTSYSTTYPEITRQSGGEGYALYYGNSSGSPIIASFSDGKIQTGASGGTTVVSYDTTSAPLYRVTLAPWGGKALNKQSSSGMITYTLK